MYEKTWEWEFVLLGPLVYKPDPFPKLAEPDPAGNLIVELTADLICESKNGTVGEEGECQVVSFRLVCFPS